MILSYLILSYLILSYLILSYLILSYLILSYQAEIDGWLDWNVVETGDIIYSPGLVPGGTSYPVCADIANWTLATLEDLECE